LRLKILLLFVPAVPNLRMSNGSTLKFSMLPSNIMNILLSFTWFLFLFFKNNWIPTYLYYSICEEVVVVVGGGGGPCNGGPVANCLNKTGNAGVLKIILKVSF
jgi:hypothetical protein